jgi:phosphoglycolate phosphatase-like HAD superfamily hydrolase
MAETKSLDAFQPRHDFLVALDSDGCVFDSMEIKHKECFTPQFIKHWNLQAAAKYARQVWEFANLYSVHRGANRFPVLVTCLDLLMDYPLAVARGIQVPDLQPLRDFANSKLPPSNASLTRLIQEKPHPVLDQTLAWSHAVNAAVHDIVKGVPPFPKVIESLERILAKADLNVVSGTPGEALVREWEEHKIDHYPAVIAGQELGKKTEHLSAFKAGNRYQDDHTLMVGDAPGDLKAALATDTLFFPINPGHEEDSWQRLHDEGLDRFFAGTFRGPYEQSLISEFEKLLPSRPPWKES